MYEQIKKLIIRELMSPIVGIIVMDVVFKLIEKMFNIDIKMMIKYVEDSIFYLNKNIIIKLYAKITILTEILYLF